MVLSLRQVKFPSHFTCSDNTEDLPVPIPPRPAPTTLWEKILFAYVGFAIYFNCESVLLFSH